MPQVTTMERARAGSRAAIAAAIRRHPAFELAIRRLMIADEEFREICEELAEAEAALGKVDDLPQALRDVRRAEWQHLVDRLAGEVKAALDRPGAGTRPVRPRSGGR